MGSTRVTNFSDLIQRVTANCLLHPLGSNRFERDHGNHHRTSSHSDDEEEQQQRHSESESGEDSTPVKCEKEGVERNRNGGGGGGEYRCSDNKDDNNGNVRAAAEVDELVTIMNQVFDSVSTMKRAYMEFQSSHSPWDPAKMRVADEVVVSQLKRIGVFRERFKRRASSGGKSGVMESGTGEIMMREVVAPYEAVVEEMRREVKVKDEEVEMLKERLKRVSVSPRNSGGRSKRKGNGYSNGGKDHQSSAAAALALVPVSPSPELFESTMFGVRKSIKSFASLLLSLMRSAKWDISAAVRSIESAAAATAASPLTPSTTTTTATSSSPTGSHHARYSLESYVTGKLFQGFDHETFYMDGTLHSLLDPANFRRECFSKFKDMRSMDSTELLGVTPTCQFGGFCAKKYLAIMHPKMEESLLGDLEHRRMVSSGEHPRTEFYKEFLAAAKAVWLLHLMAFSLDPVPSHFEAARGAEFRMEYMESVVKLPSANGVLKKLLPGFVVGLPVTPGFKLANGSVIKARVFLASRS